MISSLVYPYHPEGFEAMVILEQSVLSKADTAVSRLGVLPEVRLQEIKGHLHHRGKSISFMTMMHAFCSSLRG